MKKSFLPIALSILAALALNGCIGLHFGGGSRSSMTNKSQTYDVSLGQQLIDLQKAYEAGIITEHEYNVQKKKLLRHYGSR